MGGEFAPTAKPASGVSLALPGMDRDAVAERHEALLAAGYVRPIAFGSVGDPGRADGGIRHGRARWWDAEKAAGEYGREGGDFPQMPDNYTPSRTGGLGTDGLRRTHRMAYSGAGVTLRMPSATSIKRFQEENGGTFVVPVTATYPPDRDITGWVKLTRHGSGWTASGGGFPDGADEQVAEAVACVLEARRPTTALRAAGDMLDRRRQRIAAEGTTFRAMDSTFIQSAAYDQATGTLGVQMPGDRIYGYAVSPATARAFATSASIGGAYNELIKNRMPRREVQRCARCSRFTVEGNVHRCPGSHNPAPTRTSPAYTQSARAAGTRATS